MNLLLINYEYPPIGGGAATATRALARALLAQGHQVHVLTASFGAQRGDSCEDGVQVHRIPAVRRRAEACSVPEMITFLASALLRVRPLVRRHRIDASLAFFSIPSAPIAWWARRPYVVSLRGGDVPGTEPGLKRIHELLAAARRRLLRSARAVVANSEGLRRLSEAADPIPVSVIPNGVDTVFFRPASPIRPQGESFRWIFVGRLQSQKNLSWLLTQFAALRPTVPHFTLDIVGDGPLRPELERQARETGLADRLRWHGWQSREKLRELYQNADALINPSLYEGMPNVVLEAMACGLPVVASRVAGNDALVHDDQNGYLFPLDEPAALAHAAHCLLAAEWRARLGDGARQTALQHSWSAAAEAYIRLFS